MNQNAFPSSSNADNDLQAQFDRWAAAYDADVAASAAEGESGGHGFPFAGYDRVLARVVALAAVAPGMAVLELGPGTGNLTAQLVARGAAVWALDFSAEMLARARVRVPTATFAQAHLLGDYPPDFHRSFACVASTYTFHELPLPDKLTLLRRLFADHLRPGGAVAIGDVGSAAKWVSVKRAGEMLAASMAGVSSPIPNLFVSSGTRFEPSSAAQVTIVLSGLRKWEANVARIFALRMPSRYSSRSS